MLHSVVVYWTNSLRARMCYVKTTTLTVYLCNKRYFSVGWNWKSLLLPVKNCLHMTAQHMHLTFILNPLSKQVGECQSQVSVHAIIWSLLIVVGFAGLLWWYNGTIPDQLAFSIIYTFICTYLPTYVYTHRAIPSPVSTTTTSSNSNSSSSSRSSKYCCGNTHPQWTKHVYTCKDTYMHTRTRTHRGHTTCCWLGRRGPCIPTYLKVKSVVYLHINWVMEM